MSLRRKIILLFGVLAILPLMGLAGFSYWNARSLLMRAVQDQVRQSAGELASDLSGETDRIERSLTGLGRVLNKGDSTQWRAGLQAFAGTADSVLERAVYVGFRDSGGQLRLLRGSEPDEPVRCLEGESSRLVSFGTTVGSGEEGPGTFLEAAFWMSALVRSVPTNPSHRFAVQALPDGSALYQSGCPGLDGDGGWVRAAFGSLAASDEQGELTSFQFEDDEGLKAGGAALVTGRAWRVVAASPLGSVLGPLQRLMFWYWALVLALGASTALAFSIMIRRYTRSLSELVRAAEEAGRGELDPWLPLPSSGEVGQLTLAFSRMLDRLRDMMTQVSQSGRLAVVGQLSAYLAHEIRNPLSSIKLNLQRLLRWTRSGRLPDYCREPLEISLKEVERLNASVTGVLQLSRAEDSQQEVVGLHQLIEEAVGLVASRFASQGVEVRMELDAEADRVLARPGQLKSAALNLMVNALEAQPDGGKLEIGTTLRAGDDDSGPVLALHFKDAGRGIPPEIRGRIFEPFFTTKPGGAGIGLAMAKQAVEENGGELFLEPSFSWEDGAEFVVVFPLAATNPRVGSSPLQRSQAERSKGLFPGQGVNQQSGETDKGVKGGRRVRAPRTGEKALMGPGSEMEEEG